MSPFGRSRYLRRPASDKGQKAIVDALRACGALVWPVSSSGIPDLLVGFRKRYCFLEVKAPVGVQGGKSKAGQKLSEAQERFRQASVAAGLPFFTVRTPEEALAAVGLQGNLMDAPPSTTGPVPA